MIHSEPTLFDEQRMGFDEALDLTALSLNGMTSLQHSIATNRLEIHRRILHLLGQLYNADRPLPRLTWHQEILINCLRKHIEALYDLVELDEAQFTRTPAEGAQPATVPELPFVDAVVRVQIPGEPLPPFVPELAVVLSWEEANRLVGTGLWKLTATVQQASYVLERKEPSI